MSIHQIHVLFVSFLWAQGIICLRQLWIFIKMETRKQSIKYINTRCEKNKILCNPIIMLKQVIIKYTQLKIKFFYRPVFIFSLVPLFMKCFTMINTAAAIYFITRRRNRKQLNCEVKLIKASLKYLETRPGSCKVYVLLNRN